jgi:hypothetical protein
MNSHKSTYKPDIIPTKELTPGSWQLKAATKPGRDGLRVFRGTYGVEAAEQYAASIRRVEECEASKRAKELERAPVVGSMPVAEQIVVNTAEAA